MIALTWAILAAMCAVFWITLGLILARVDALQIFDLMKENSNE